MGLVTIVMTLFVPAQADAAPYWSTYTRTSDWTCYTVQHTAVAGLYYAPCMVVSGSTTQTVLVVTNRSGRAIRIYGDNYNSSTGWAFCYTSTLSNGYSRACAGPVGVLGNCATASGTVHLVVDGANNAADTYSVRGPCRI